MTIQSDIAEVKAALDIAEEDMKRARRSLRRFHNLLARKFADNAELLGCSESDVIALGGGVDKPPPEDD